MSKDTLTQLGLKQSNLRSCNLNNLNVVWVGSATTKRHYAHISFCSAESAVLVTFRSSKKKTLGGANFIHDATDNIYEVLEIEAF